MSYQNQYDYEKALINQNQHHHQQYSANDINNNNSCNGDLYRAEVNFFNSRANQPNGYLTDANGNNRSSYQMDGSYSATSTLNRANRNPKNNVYASNSGNVASFYDEALNGVGENNRANLLQKPSDFRMM